MKRGRKPSLFLCFGTIYYMETWEKVGMGVLGAIVIGGGATLGMNMTTDIPETSTERPTRSSAISTTKATTTTSQEKSKTKEPVVTHTEVETEINDYWFTETVAVEVPMQPVPNVTITEKAPAVTITAPPVTITETITNVVTTTVTEVADGNQPTVFYRTCDDVRAALGRGNITSDEAGFHPGLDNDNDGVGCEE